MINYLICPLLFPDLYWDWVSFKSWFYWVWLTFYWGWQCQKFWWHRHTFIWDYPFPWFCRWGLYFFVASWFRIERFRTSTVRLWGKGFGFLIRDFWRVAGSFCFGFPTLGPVVSTGWFPWDTCRVFRCWPRLDACIWRWSRWSGRFPAVSCRCCRWVVWFWFRRFRSGCPFVSVCRAAVDFKT